MARDQSIAVSEQELEMLDEVAHDAFGHRNVPYGAVISLLINNYHDDSNNRDLAPNGVTSVTDSEELPDGAETFRLFSGEIIVSEQDNETGDIEV